MTLDPSNALRFGQGFFPQNLVAIEHFLAIWPLVDPRWPLHDLWPQQCTALWSGALLTKFGSHRAFLRQIDPWMTFNPRWGRFQNMPTNLVGPSPTSMPSFSSIPQSMAKRIAGHTYIHTYIYTYRLHYFSSIDVVITYKIGSFLCSIVNLLQKNVIVFFFGTQISKWRSFEKGAIFDLLFTFFSHQGKVTKNPSAYISLSYIHVFCSPYWLFLPYQFWKKYQFIRYGFSLVWVLVLIRIPAILEQSINNKMVSKI